jgi:hypothetical protein
MPIRLVILFWALVGVLPFVLFGIWWEEEQEIKAEENFLANLHLP